MKYNPRVERGRLRTGEYPSARGDLSGAFMIEGPCGQMLRIVASNGVLIPWEHVSVSTKNRCPNWAEMNFVKELFWDAEEAVMQLHPPRSRYVNNHPYCLHLWRPLEAEIPLPPTIAVGFMTDPEKEKPTPWRDTQDNLPRQ